MNIITIKVLCPDPDQICLCPLNPDLLVILGSQSDLLETLMAIPRAPL